MDFAKLENSLGYIFKDRSMLLEAFTHPSVKKRQKSNVSYQRLEFFGDKVLGLIIAEHLFEMFPNETEGEISKRHAHLVCGEVCAQIASQNDLGSYLILSDSQEKDHGRTNDKILENVLESLIGAMYFDAGLAVTKKIVLKLFKDTIDVAKYIPQDSKSKLQEWVQKKYQMTPIYDVSERLVGDGNKLFEVSVTIAGLDFIQNGMGKTRKSAEKAAALKMIEFLKI